MEKPEEHNIYGPDKHGRRELPIEATGVERWDPNLAGGFENAEAIEDIVSDGIYEANMRGAVINDSAARAIGRALANAHNSDAPALDAFARTGEGDRRDIEQEYIALYEDPDTPMIVRNWIDWLATFLFHAKFKDEQIRGGLPYKADRVPYILVTEVIYPNGQSTTIHRPAAFSDFPNQSTEQLGKLLIEHGDPLRAYLELGDIDATAASLIDDFRSNYVGWYSDMDEVVEGLTEIQDWERDLVQWSMERGLQGMVSLDHDGIEKVTRETWDVVEIGGRLYVFNR
jgi:hypothetical protein